MRKRAENLNEFMNEAHAETQAAADSVNTMVGKPKKPRAKSTGSKAYIHRLVNKVRQAAGKELEMVSPSELVALYYLCHWDIYGSEPIELCGETWKRAVMAAGKLIREQFNSNSKIAVEFLRWTWRRERYLESKNQNGNMRRRLTWRHQFVWKDLLSDYRVEMAKFRKAAGG